MLQLGIAVACFVVIHLFVSGTRLRDTLVAALGEGRFLGLFSLASLGTIVWISLAYGPAFNSASNHSYWFPAPWQKWLAAALILIAFELIVVGVTTKNPTAVQQDKLLEQGDPVRGILRITRHPFLWGTALWAAAHLSVNGDRASILLFSGVLLVALAGTVSIDRKRARKLGASWTDFATRTSNLPFAAILSGRNHLALAEIGVGKPVFALLVYLGVLALHPIVIHAVPLPWWPG
ncbi:NnrU family protein [Nannocystaceae bacterium ST9]